MTRTLANRPVHRLFRLPAVGLLLGLGGAIAFAAQPGAPGVSAAGLERALTEQYALLEANPGDAATEEDLGHLLALKGDLDGAEAAYRQAILLDPEAASPHFHLGSLLEKQGESRAALKEYKEAIRLDPQHAWARYEAGSIYEAWGIESRATHYYGDAFSIDPSLTDPVVNPHILENHLATQAMIYSYKKTSKNIQAPREFHEPARIAALLIDVPAATEPNDLYATEGDGGGGGYARLNSSGGQSGDYASRESGEEDGGGDSGRVLSSRDLKSGGASNQVSGSAGGAAVVGRGARDAGSARGNTRSREITRPTRNVAPRSGNSGSGSSIGPARPKSSGDSPSSGGKTPGNFAPSPYSTGRIEVVLEPVAGG